jgi:APA family basic amino acid/polyamine antiporter
MRYWFSGMVVSNLVSNGLITVAAALIAELGMMPSRWSVCIHSRAYGRLVSSGMDGFTVIQTGVIAAIAVTFANYSAIFSCFR